MYQTLNKEQKYAADSILTAAQDQTTPCRYFFVDGPGGSGKTYLYEALNHLLKAKGLTVTNVAWSGIAAQLLPRGSTVHSTFKLPVPVTQDNYLSFLRPNSIQAQTLRNTNVLIWDEAPMSPRFGVEAVDEFFKDVCQDENPFGCKVVVFGGDFRQIPPVIRGNIAQTMEASIKRSNLWQLFKVLTLSTNVRASTDPAFATMLLDIGNGTYPEDDNGQVSIPENMLSKGDLIAETYGSTLSEQSLTEISKRAILCPRNRDCFNTNEHILKILPGEERTYFSSDSAFNERDNYNYPVEFLNTLVPSG